MLEFIKGFINKIAVNDLQSDAMMLMVKNQFDNLSDKDFESMKNDALKIIKDMNKNEVKNVFS